MFFGAVSKIWCHTIKIFTKVTIYGYLGGKGATLCCSRRHPQSVKLDKESTLILAVNSVSFKNEKK